MSFFSICEKIQLGFREAQCFEKHDIFTPDE